MSKGLSYIPRKEQTENLMQKSFYEGGETAKL